VRQLTLISFESDIWLNFNKVLFKEMSLKHHAHFLHSSRKRAAVPRVSRVGGYLFLRCGEKYCPLTFHTLPHVSIVISSSVVLFFEGVCARAPLCVCG
jgi:hypothetical protein